MFQRTCHAEEGPLFDFEAIKLCEIDHTNSRFMLEFTGSLVPGFPVGYQVTGLYHFNESMFITLLYLLKKPMMALSLPW